MLNLAAIKAVAIKALTFCKNIITATGPLAVVSRVLSIGTIVVAVVKLVKKLIQKIKSHKKAKSPETTTEYALADEKIRENAPAETKAKYEASVKKTANKLVGKSKKKDRDMAIMINAGAQQEFPVRITAQYTVIDNAGTAIVPYEPDAAISFLMNRMKKMQEMKSTKNKLANKASDNAKETAKDMTKKTNAWAKYR